MAKGESCTDSVPMFQSYHIHVLFWGNNANSTAAAESLRKQFMEEYSLTDEANGCKYNPGDLQETDLCMFETDYGAAGPFLTAQWAAFVPISLYESAVSWTLRHKGRLDVLVHPNSGCGIQDHVMHALWGGNKWELDASIFVS